MPIVYTMPVLAPMPVHVYPVATLLSCMYSHHTAL